VRVLAGALYGAACAPSVSGVHATGLERAARVLASGSFRRQPASLRSTACHRGPGRTAMALAAGRLGVQQGCLLVGAAC
jgi:hypothetical protein